MTPRPVNRLLAEMLDSFRMGMSAVSAHKLRSSLTLLGVLIGVFSIIVVMTAMRVMQAAIESEISGLGSQTFMVQRLPIVVFDRPEGWEKIRRRKNITYQHFEGLQEKATLALNVGVQSDFFAGQIETARASTPPGVRLYGETAGSFAALKWVLHDGRLFGSIDVENARNVCVLGSGVASNLFATASALGEQVKIDGIPYTVIGVLEPKGGLLDRSGDNFAVVPITSALNRYGSTYRSLQILVQARDQASYDECMEQVRSLLRVIRKVPPGESDDFEILSNDSVVAQFNAFTLAVRMGVALISSIALLAAGIGIMNIMLVSVTERTREIGIRRAVGAKKRNIMMQFIMEAIVLCELGGIAGVVLGILGGNATALLLKLPPVIPVDWVIIGLAICSLVGVIFGSYPAWKAANLDPIESLRYE